MSYEPLPKCSNCGGSLISVKLFDNIFYKHFLVYECINCGRFKKNESQFKEYNLDD